MPSTRTPRTEYQCSFCSKGQKQVRRLIAGPGRVFICDECVILCQQIITDESTAPANAASAAQAKAMAPKTIYQKLDEYVVRQERAKKVLSVAVYNHYKRSWTSAKDNGVELQKSNILLIGPTGSGKTLLAQTLARILDVPLAIADATSLTEAGYVGEDVENILLRLIQAADYDITRAEHGIIYIDEIDKIARKSPNPSITRDVSGEGVQQALLKIIEGCIANVPPQGGRKHPHQEFLQIKTDDILFICGGAFEGLDVIVEKRNTRQNRTIGFNSDSKRGNSQQKEDWLKRTTPEDLLEYGYIPEFVGRMAVLASLESLDKSALIQVMTEPKNAITKQYKSLFSMDEVELEFTEEALEAAAEEALKRKAGARGLRSIMEETLLDVMYELPSHKEIKRCVIDAECIYGKNLPTLLNEAGEYVHLPRQELKSA